MQRSSYLYVCLALLLSGVFSCGGGGGEGTAYTGSGGTQTTADPTFSPTAGTYTSTQNVTLTCSTPGSSIRYTTDNSTPTSSSTLYSGSIPVSATTTIKAIAMAAGHTNSNLVTGVYTINLPSQATTPAFSPAPGTYTNTQNVTLSCATTGSSIYYTTNGATPTTSSTHYTAPISVSATTTIRAIAHASGYTDSGVAIGTYTINLPSQTATPTFSPAPGTYTNTQNVTLSCATTGSSIYYTTSGATPTTSSTRYTGPISVSATTTIRAIAHASGYTDSGEATGIYTINNGSADISWTAPTTDVNGGALAELTGYKVFYCFSSSAQCNNYSTTPIATIGTVTSYTATGLGSGYHCYDVKAYNSGGDSPSSCGSGNYCCKHIQ